MTLAFGSLGEFAVAEALPLPSTANTPFVPITITPQVPAIAAGARVVVPNLAISLALGAPDIIVPSTPTLGITFTPQAPTIKSGVTIHVENTLSQTSSGGLASASLGEFGLTEGASSTSTRPVTINLVPQPPEIRTGVILLLPELDITLAPQAPSIATGVEVVVPNLPITFGLQTPHIAEGISIFTGTVGITLTAQAPSIRAGVRVDVPVAAITIVPQVPEIDARSRRVAQMFIAS